MVDETHSMTETNTPPGSQDSAPPQVEAPVTTKGKGKAFFDRGDQVAATGNWDFAIQMYLDGIRREPTEVQRGHRPLREVAMKRTAQQGKPAGMIDQLKHRGGKTPEEVLANAEYLMAKEPGSIQHMVAVFKAIQKFQSDEATGWICDILLGSQQQAVQDGKKPNRQIVVTIARAYEQIKEFTKAHEVALLGKTAFKDDGELQDMEKNYSAQKTIQQGKYAGDGSFVDSVKDLKKQQDLLKKDQAYQDIEFREGEIVKARKAYEATPTVPGKIDALVEALTKIEEDSFENEAIDVLKAAYADSRAYRFKVRMDDIRIRQMRRQYDKLVTDGDEKAAKEQDHRQLAFELEVFAERAVKYPTDMGLKYELGQRQLKTGQIDDAIASLQQATRDAKRRILALALLGQAFARKGWHRQAIETYEKALESDVSEERAKDLHYNLGLELKALGEREKAMDHFSEVAQLDFRYKDVREQIEDLRKKGA